VLRLNDDELPTSFPRKEQSCTVQGLQLTRESALSGTASRFEQKCSNTTDTIHTARMQADTMPHSTTPESNSADTPSATASQVDNIKPEPTTQDATMEDASSPVAAEKTRVDLEDLFDDEDSDGEFASSAPVKPEDEASQPAPMYAATPP
jgi:hypothetical protein